MSNEENTRNHEIEPSPAPPADPPLVAYEPPRLLTKQSVATVTLFSCTANPGHPLCGP
jgi:hypothetical protein